MQATVDNTAAALTPSHTHTHARARRRQRCEDRGRWLPVAAASWQHAIRNVGPVDQSSRHDSSAARPRVSKSRRHRSLSRSSTLIGEGFSYICSWHRALFLPPLLHCCLLFSPLFSLLFFCSSTPATRFSSSFFLPPYLCVCARACVCVYTFFSLSLFSILTLSHWKR